tara:strand:+ start:189 stop:1193 length:1005 start_codon:yes stop_codon:yes gene_type:complete
MVDSQYKLNLPPESYISVKHTDMEYFVSSISKACGLSPTRSDLLARLLTENDLRGVFSHGTRQICRYAPAIKNGYLNNDPEVKIIKETPTSIIMDGDGGLGYFPLYDGTLKAIEKTKQTGVAILQTRNHGHIGAAGIYSRIPLKYNFASFVTGGGNLDLHPGQPVYTPAIGSPMSISAPAGNNPPFVVDFAPVYDLRISPRWDELSKWIPGTIFKCIGLGMIAQVWGGIMAGSPASRSDQFIKEYKDIGANAFIFMFDVGLFIDIQEYNTEIGKLVDQIRNLSPLDGIESANYAGGIESDRESEFRERGIPVGLDHKKDLESVAGEFDVSLPWE